MIAHPNELTYFVELAHTLNFSRASERIGISQPALSAAIKRLETEIGTELFIRRKTGLVLTPAAKRLLSHSKQLLQLWNTVKTEAIASHQEIQGCFTLGCHSSVGLYTLPLFLSNLLKQHPKLEIKLKHDLSRKITEDVINFSVDIGIVVNPIKHPDLIIRKLFNDKIAFWYSTSIKDIALYMNSGEAVIICDPDLMQTQWLLKRLAKMDIHHRLLTSNNLEVIAALTESGVGIGILPGGVANSLRFDNLKIVPKMPSYHDEIALLYRHENRHIKTIEVITSAVKKALCVS